MPDIYRSEKKNVGDLLAGRFILSPNQRKYSWDTSQVEIFWQDIMFFSEQNSGGSYRSQEYFLGSVVVIDPPGAIEKELLDGQQRLATATILLSVIRDILIELGFTDSAVTLQDRYISSIDELQETEYYHITLSQYDKEFFAREIQQRRDNGSYIEPVTEFKSHELIRAARNFFRGTIIQQIGALSTPIQKKKWLLRLKELLLNSVTLIQVSSSDKDKAALVFETLNDRGIGLSTPDLLRNFMLDRVPSASDKEQVSKNWEDVLELEGNARSEDFIRHFWISRYGDVKSRSLYREIKMRVMTDELPIMGLSRELSDEAEIYESIITAVHSDLEIQRLLKGVDFMGAQALLPAILSIFVVGNLEQQKLLLKALITLYIRHTVVGGLENAKLEQFVFRVAKNIRAANVDVPRIIDEIKSFAPSDTSFVMGLNTVTIPRSGAARFILSEIEMVKRGPSSEVSINGVAAVNLEHIYPKNPSFARLANHDELVNRLGNLTLLQRRINTGVKNGNFNSKKAVYEASDLLITKELAQFQNWTEIEIQARQNDLSQVAASIWKF